MELPKNYDKAEAEKRWQRYWEEHKLYRFDPKSGKKLYIIDTPPPTVSGKMHVGHAFSYSQQDFVARYKRMSGFEVYYPFGTDDNGLPTERLVEKIKGVKSTKMKRAEFVKLCEDTIKEIKDDFVSDWKRLGMSCDFESTYSTIDSHCIHTSQLSFLDLHKKGLVYQHEAPTMWCAHCQTAIAQADLEDAELASSFNDVEFQTADGGKFTIGTTRPELIGACVAIFVHPDDGRHKHMHGKKAKVPLFGQIVPIIADESANPEKGSGILMICSYGDRFDVAAVNRHDLEPRIVLTKDGSLNELAGKYKGMKMKDARKAILDDLEKEGLLLGKKPIKHTVNVHERCKNEVEFLATKQWFIKIIDNKDKLLDAANSIKWYPSHMKARYDNWVQGLEWDWCISRQRHFGVPFPVWHCKKCGKAKVAEESELPIDPLQKMPKGKCACGSHDFIGENDVMDTWATSSVTPQIISNWVADQKRGVSFEETYPNTLRPQAHDIIRTWAFYTIVKGMYNNGALPWSEILISGHVQDKNGKKMSKSLGNVVDPREVFGKYSVDAWRYFSGGSKLGDDVPFQEKDIVSGEKFITKLWNAGKFTIMHLEGYEPGEPKKIEMLDRWILSRLSRLIKSATESFDLYEYSRARLELEHFFWRDFCDNYLEIIKDRIYNPEGRGKDAKISAQYGLYESLLSVLKISAPFMPYITEEMYHIYFAKEEGEKSIHISSWPKMSMIDERAERIGDVAVRIVEQARKVKSEKNVSLKTDVERIDVAADISKEDFDSILDDIKAVTRAKEISFEHGKEFRCEIIL